MSVSAPVPQRLLDSVDESVVVAYVKDLDGRYLHVNTRYQEFFGITADDVRGRQDESLEPRQTIDGPRLAAGSVADDEPLQLEYTVAPFDGRPALAVWRFAVRSANNDTIAVCGVAAPVVDGPLARRECDRLMAIATDAVASAEPPPGAREVPEARTDSDRIAALHDVSATAARRAHELLSELTVERERRAEAESRAAEADELRRRSEAAEAAVLAERARAEQADSAAQKERVRADAADAAALAERSRADEALASLNAVRAELNSAHAEMASEREQRTQTGEEVTSELRQRLKDVEAAAQREREGAEASLNFTRAELETAHAELASEREQQAGDEAEVIGDLRRKLQGAVTELNTARTQLQTAHADEIVNDLRHKLEEATSTSRQERARADAAEAAVISERADAEIRLAVSDRRIAELEASLADARARELEVATEYETTGPRWDSSAQRAFTTALSQSSDWRVGVKSAIGVLGAQGGWDAVCAWQPDDKNGCASCFAMWTGENRGLAALETATWQRRQPLTGSTIGEAVTWETSQWLAADPRARDRRLQLLAQHGIRGALIVPVKDGNRSVAALELLTVGATPPSRELIEAIETMALQLGHFSHLLCAGAQPRWRFGRT